MAQPRTSARSPSGLWGCASCLRETRSTICNSSRIRSIGAWALHHSQNLLLVLCCGHLLESLAFVFQSWWKRLNGIQSYIFWYYSSPSSVSVSVQWSTKPWLEELSGRSYTSDWVGRSHSPILRCLYSVCHLWLVWLLSPPSEETELLIISVLQFMSLSHGW